MFVGQRRLPEHRVDNIRNRYFARERSVHQRRRQSEFQSDRSGCSWSFPCGFPANLWVFSLDILLFICDFAPRLTFSFRFSISCRTTKLETVKYVPDWFPGTGFKQTAKLWERNALEVLDAPFNTVKRNLVRTIAYHHVIALRYLPLTSGKRECHTVLRLILSGQSGQEPGRRAPGVSNKIHCRHHLLW